MSANPFQGLGAYIRRIARSEVRRAHVRTGLELGIITATGLKLDNFKHEVQDYLKADGLVLVAGDRVAVAPIGDDFLVITKVVENA